MGQGHPCWPNSPLTQTTLGQMCAAPWVTRSRPAATEPGLEPRISRCTASTVMQCLRTQHHSGGPQGLNYNSKLNNGLIYVMFTFYLTISLITDLLTTATNLNTGFHTHINRQSAQHCLQLRAKPLLSGCSEPQCVHRAQCCIKPFAL
jgi:hypothetical protein